MMRNSILLLLAIVGYFIGAALASPPSTAPTTRPAGHLKYKLAGDWEKWPEDKRKLIVDAMDAAIALYNENSDFQKTITAHYSPGTPTADGNINGTIRFGKSFGRRVALHEIGHTLGIGTDRNWGKLMIDHKWTGKIANDLLKEFDGPDAVLKGDHMHFWPYGLNYDKESSPVNDIRHVKMVEAMRKDMDSLNGK